MIRRVPSASLRGKKILCYRAAGKSSKSVPEVLATMETSRELLPPSIERGRAA